MLDNQNKARLCLFVFTTLSIMLVPIRINAQECALAQVRFSSDISGTYQVGDSVSLDIFYKNVGTCPADEWRFLYVSFSWNYYDTTVWRGEWADTNLTWPAKINIEHSTQDWRKYKHYPDGQYMITVWARELPYRPGSPHYNYLGGASKVPKEPLYKIHRGGENVPPLDVGEEKSVTIKVAFRQQGMLRILTSARIEPNANDFNRWWPYNDSTIPEFRKTDCQMGVWAYVHELIIGNTPNITGYVRTSKGNGISGVTLTFSNKGDTTTTDNNGYFSKALYYGWSGRVTPSMAGYTFVPSSISYNNITSDQSDQNYIGYTPPLPPSNLIAQTISTSQINLSWQDVSDNEDGYYIERKLATDEAFQQIATLDADTTSYNNIELNPNTEYCYRVCAYNVAGNSDYSNEVCTTTPPLTVSVSNTFTFPSRSEASTYKATDYRIVGLPGASDVLISELLLGTHNTDWQIFWDNGNPSSNPQEYLEEFDGSSTFRFSVGRAFWLINKGPLSITTTIPIPQLNDSGEVEIPLHSGWNMITNPFDKSIEWEKIQTANNNLAQPIWFYDGSFTMSTDFNPFDGYYFDNTDIKLSSLRIPYSLVHTSQLTSDNQNTIKWKVNIILSSGEFVDRATSFGIASEANRRLDHLDFRKPRTIASVPSVFFHRPGWDANYSTFATDIRPEFEGCETWDLVVSSTLQQNAQLSFNGIGGIPQDYKVYLIDEEIGTCINLREKPTYRFKSVGGSTHFRIAVGPSNMVQQELGKVHLPKQFSLGESYPNPFNQQTKISYSLPSTVWVKIDVYNLKGQKMRTLVNSQQSAGRYLIIWDGKNANKESVASGMYVLRMEAASFITARKLVLVR